MIVAAYLIAIGFALIFLSALVAALRQVALALAVIAACYTAWLRGQPEYENEAVALLKTIGVINEDSPINEEK